MAQPESQRSEFEEPSSSNHNAESASIERSGADKPESFQSDVEDMLDSMEAISVDSQRIEEQSESEIDVPPGKVDSLEDAPFPASDELLMQAGSILNGSEIELPNSVEEEDFESDSADPEEEGLMSMPDPQSLMQEAGAESESSNTNDAPQVAPNKAERAGDLPPPPPAPVALEEDEIEMGTPPLEAESSEESEDSIERNAQKDEKPEDLVPTDEGGAVSEDDRSESIDEADTPSGDSLEEPESDDDDLLLDDDDDSLLMDGEVGEVLFVSDDGGSGSVAHSEVVSPVEAGSSDLSSKSVEEPVQVSRGVLSKNRLLEKILRSLPLAAGLALLGIGLILSSFKSEVFEFVEHGDTHGSWLNGHIAAITAEVFEELDPDTPYRMIWLDSDVQRVSDSEFQINARIGAELKVDLYQPVDDSFVYSNLPFDSEALSSATLLLESVDGPRELDLPTHGWTRIYKHSASEGEVFPMEISYRLTKSSSDWELSRLRLDEEGGFAWSRGRPKAFFGPGAMDVKSEEFAHSFRAFKKAGTAYLKMAQEAEKAHLANLDEEAKLAQEERENLMMALSQGSSFKGMVIAGLEGADAREISLIITETRIGGGLIKGILKLGDDSLPAKHFTGILDLIENEEGVQGQLNLTTIAFAGQSALANTPPFFNPGTVSRIKLHTDGYRMEGDATDISLRLIRSL